MAMSIFDLHSDRLYKNPNFSREKLGFTGKIICAVYSGNISFSRAVEIAENFNKNKQRNLYLAFENVGYKDLSVEKIIQLKPLYASLTYNEENDLGFGCYEDKPLKSLGKSVAKRLNNGGICIDVAHLSTRGVYDVLSLGVKTLCSHTAVNNVYEHRRNLSVETILSIVNSGGIVGITPVSYFIGNNPTVLDYFKHIDTAVQKVGARGISIGSDFYGSDSFVKGINNYSDFSALKIIMENHGYTINDIQNIFYNNANDFFNL